jgi:hypothetical protein
MKHDADVLNSARELEEADIKIADLTRTNSQLGLALAESTLECAALRAQVQELVVQNGRLETLRTQHYSQFAAESQAQGLSQLGGYYDHSHQYHQHALAQQAQAQQYQAQAQQYYNQLQQGIIGSQLDSGFAGLAHCTCVPARHDVLRGR